MLTNRLRPPDDKNIVYHYCSAETFLAIIQNKTIRFSDINQLNDAEEARWGYRVFENAATNLIKKENINTKTEETIHGLDLPFINEIDRIWSKSGLNVTSFVSCFSTDGDSLSQWRAYADDGAGFAIGFKASELARLPVKVLDVEYSPDLQISEMQEAICTVYQNYVRNNKNVEDDNFFNDCLYLAMSAIAFKNPAWRDEKEVRCQHLIRVNIVDDVMSLEDPGGLFYDKKIAGQPIKFQSRKGSIVPFMDMPFEVSSEHAPIHEVVLGPRCPNAPGNILLALGNAGFGPIGLRAAGSAYR